MTHRKPARPQAALIRSLGPIVLLAFGVACGDEAVPLGVRQPPGQEDPVDPPQYPVEPTPGSAAIYVAEADGQHARRLTAGARPAWSPDGQRMAFERGGDIYVINDDGTGERLLGSGREPAWAPDGTRIVYASFTGISVMRDDGTGDTTILPHGFRHDTNAEWDMGVGKPSWSPDGSRIAFEHRGDGDVTPAQIFVMNADGSDPRRLTPTSGTQYAESDPAWSPGGGQILFWSYGYGIATVPAAGGTPWMIYRSFPTVAYGAKPAWSPDGRAIAFTANRYLPESLFTWLVPLTGGPAVVLIQGGADAVWSPDGAQIAFTYMEIN